MLLVVLFDGKMHNRNIHGTTFLPSQFPIIQELLRGKKYAGYL